MRNIFVLLSGCVFAVPFGAVFVNHVESSNSVRDPEGSYSEDNLGPARAERFNVEKWPVSVSASYGFEWDADTYAELEGFTEQENVTAASEAYWKDESLEFRCFVSRTVRLENDAGIELTVSIIRCPNYDAAKNQMTRPFTSSSRLRFDDRHGAAFGLNLGDISIVRDAPYPSTGDFQGVDSNDLVFVRGNLVVDVGFSVPNPERPGFTAPSCASPSTLKSSRNTTRSLATTNYLWSASQFPPPSAT